MLNRLDGSVVRVDPDVLRKLHPDHSPLERDKVDVAGVLANDTRKWTDEAIERGINARSHLVIDGTLSSSNHAEQRIRQLKDAGYVVDVRVVAVSAEASTIGITKRYADETVRDGAGRWVDQRYHDWAYEGVAQTVARLDRDDFPADRLTIYARDGKALYRRNHSEEPVRSRPGRPTALDTLNHERAQPVPPDLVIEARAAVLGHQPAGLQPQDREPIKDSVARVEQIAAAQVVRAWMAEHPEYDLGDANDVVSFVAKRENASRLPEGMTARDVARCAPTLHAMLEAEDRAAEITRSRQRNDRTPEPPSPRQEPTGYGP